MPFLAAVISPFVNMPFPCIVIHEVISLQCFVYVMSSRSILSSYSLYFIIFACGEKALDDIYRTQARMIERKQ